MILTIFVHMRFFSVRFRDTESHHDVYNGYIFIAYTATAKLMALLCWPNDVSGARNR